MRSKKTIKLMMVVSICCLLAANVFAARKQVFYANFQHTYHAPGDVFVPVYTGTDQVFINAPMVNGYYMDSVAGVPDLAYDFQGAQYFEVADEDCLDLNEYDFQIEFWVKTSSTKTNNTIIDKRDSHGTGYHVTLYNGRPLLQLHDTVYGPYNYIAPNAINDGAWHIVTIFVQKDGYGFSSDSYMYVDGVLVLNLNTYKHTTGSIANTSNLLIGKNRFSTSYYFDGVLDEIRFYTGPRGFDVLTNELPTKE